MRRALAGVLAAFAVCSGAPAQELPVLYLKVSVLSADGQPIPVARHALLISENPPTAVPRRVVTSTEGTAEIRLRPGNYTVESDRPFLLDGRTYEWVQTLDVVAGRDTTLELTTDAGGGAVKAGFSSDVATAPTATGPRRETILSAWQASAFGLWTPLAHAAGFLADERGLVVTSARAIGDAEAIEVQVSQDVKVMGAVIVADRSRDVAVVRVHPSAVDGLPPVPIACEATGSAVPEPGRYAIEVPLFGPKEIGSSFVVPAGAAGGPVFAGDGRAVGLTSPITEADMHPRADVRVVGAEGICEALAVARGRVDAGPPPAATRLPVEPTRRLPAGGPTTAAARAFSFSPYQLSSSDFDILFITPAVLAAAAGRREWTGGRVDEVNLRRLATDFEHWSDYVAAAPPLLFVRVSPRLVEGFWMKVARAAASTQGAQIPPIKRLRPGFSRMRLLCGGQEVPPIHPFRIQARVTDTDAIEEGFYVFDPGAIGPDCGSVSIVLSSVKDAARMETRAVDPAIVRRVWEDFASLRAASDK
jgi:hypothetical protein